MKDDIVPSGKTDLTFETILGSLNNSIKIREYRIKYQTGTETWKETENSYIPKMESWIFSLLSSTLIKSKWKAFITFSKSGIPFKESKQGALSKMFFKDWTAFNRTVSLLSSKRPATAENKMRSRML